DAIVSVLDRVPERNPVSFRELVADADTRLEVIVRFLAVLELFKQGVVDLEQTTNFGTLSVRRLLDGEALDAASIADWDDDNDDDDDDTEDADDDTVS